MMKFLKTLITILFILIASCQNKTTPKGEVSSSTELPPPTAESIIVTTSQPSVETSVGMTVYTAKTETVKFTDPNLGYSIEYPKHWFLYVFPRSINGDVVESILISDAPGNTSTQTRTPDETARLYIASYDKKGISLSDWVIGNWNWISGPLAEISLDNRPALNSRFTQSGVSEFSLNIIWIDLESTALVLWGSVRNDSMVSAQFIEKMISSLDLNSLSK